MALAVLLMAAQFAALGQTVRAVRVTAGVVLRKIKTGHNETQQSF
jgi:hypothetical protein